jgi:hypothetical protein
MTGTIEDREAIRDILAAYAHAIDRRRWGMMERLFHADATFKFGLVEGDWRGFVEQARAIIDPCLATQHQLGQTIFGFESDSLCHTETYMTAMHHPAGLSDDGGLPRQGRDLFGDRCGAIRGPLREAWRRMAHRPAHRPV